MAAIKRNLTPKDPNDLDSDWISRAPSWSTNGREIYFMSSRPRRWAQYGNLHNEQGRHCRHAHHEQHRDGWQSTFPVGFSSHLNRRLSPLALTGVRQKSPQSRRLSRADFRALAPRALLNFRRKPVGRAYSTGLGTPSSSDVTALRRRARVSYQCAFRNSRLEVTVHGLKVIVVGVFCLASASVLATSIAGAPAAARHTSKRMVAGPRQDRRTERRKPHVPMAPASTPGQVPPEARSTERIPRGAETLRSRDVRRQWPDLPDLPQPRNRNGLAGGRPAPLPRGPPTIRCSSTTAATTTTAMASETARTSRGCSGAPRCSCGFACTDDVSVKGHPEIREVTVPRGIPTTLNTPALDPVLMLDGRQPTLQAQALGAITQHAQATRAVTARELDSDRPSSSRPARSSARRLLAALRVHRAARAGAAARAGRRPNGAAGSSSRTCRPISASIRRTSSRAPAPPATAARC